MKKGTISLVALMIVISGTATVIAKTQNSSANNSSVEKVGTTYPIAEENAIEFIKKHMEAKQKSGEMAKIEADVQNRIKEAALNMKPVEGLTLTVKPSVQYFEPQYVLPETVYDHEGKIIAAAGSIVKPLEVAPIRHKIFFFDGRQEDQVILAKKLAKEYGSAFMPILVAGRWDRISNELKQAAYFDQEGKISQSMRVTEVPVLVSQEGNKLKLESFKP